MGKKRLKSRGGGKPLFGDFSGDADVPSSELSSKELGEGLDIISLLKNPANILQGRRDEG